MDIIVKVATTASIIEPNKKSRNLIIKGRIPAKANPIKAPLEDEATAVPMPVKGMRRKKRSLVFDINLYVAKIKAIASGTYMHIWMPTSPELRNHPGAPVTPHDEYENPLFSQDQKPCWDIFNE
jgi:hypothetical protein